MAAKQQNAAVKTALVVAGHKRKAERLGKLMELIGGGEEDGGTGAGKSRV
jgi:hypothetical protein